MEECSGKQIDILFFYYSEKNVTTQSPSAWPLPKKSKDHKHQTEESVGRKPYTSRRRIWDIQERNTQSQRLSLAFHSDLRVPFDNNASERDIRKIKVKEKISGCLSSDDGADDFAKFHSIIETAMKKRNSKFNAILAIVKQ